MKTELLLSNADDDEPQEPDWMLTHTGRIFLFVLLVGVILSYFVRQTPEKLEGNRTAQISEVFIQDGHLALKVKHSKSFVDRYFETPSILSAGNGQQEQVFADAKVGDTIKFKLEPTPDKLKLKATELELIKEQ